MAHYIVSTASAPMQYCIYENGKGNNPKIKCKIRIDGYANVANKYTLQTSNCAVTEISDEEWEMLRNNSSFKDHMAKHFMFHTEVNDPKKAVVDMKAKDNSAQINDPEFAMGKDERFTPDEGMGMCQAKMGRPGGELRGKKGFQFQDPED